MDSTNVMIQSGQSVLRKETDSTHIKSKSDDFRYLNFYSFKQLRELIISLTIENEFLKKNIEHLKKENAHLRESIAQFKEGALYG